MSEATPDVQPAAPQGPRKRAPRKPSPSARDRINRIRVGVNEDERLELIRRADLAGLSLSGYCRAAALGYPVINRFDQAAIRELAKVAGDMGRLGGLMKLWLSERRGEGASVADVNRALRDLGELREQARSLMAKAAIRT